MKSVSSVSPAAIVIIFVLIILIHRSGRRRMIKRPKVEETRFDVDVDEDDEVIVLSRPCSDVEEVEIEVPSSTVTCGICKKGMESGDHGMTTLRCGHYFGRSCIFSQLDDQRSSICIVCREVFQKNDIRSIFATSDAIAPSLRQKKLASAILRNERKREQIHQKQMRSSQVKVEANITVDTLLIDHKRIRELRSRLSLPSYRIDELDSEDVNAAEFKRTASITLNDEFPLVVSSEEYVFLFGNINKSILLSTSTLTVVEELVGCVTAAILGTESNSNELLVVNENTSVQILDISSECTQTVEFTRYVTESNEEVTSPSSPQYSFITSIARTSHFVYCGLENGNLIKYDVRNASEPILFQKTINAEVGEIVIIQTDVLLCSVGSSSFIVTKESFRLAIPTLSSTIRIAAVTSQSIAIIVNSGSNNLHQICIYSISPSHSILIATIPIYQQQTQVPSSSSSTQNTIPSYPVDDDVLNGIGMTPIRCSLTSIGNHKNIIWATSDGDDVFIGSTTTPSEVQCVSRRRQAVLNLSWTRSNNPSLLVLTASQLSVFSES